MILTKPIKTANKIISVTGRVFYNDRRRRIDVKKPIRDLFAGHDEVNYTMELCLSEAKLNRRIKELAKGNVLPVLMYFSGEEGENA